MAPGTSQKFPRSWGALTPPLADFILEAVASMGFKDLTPVQAATLPLFRGNKDVVVEVRCVYTPGHSSL
jgi:ATP-dependent RNA helicase DDX55/SPB4